VKFAVRNSAKLIFVIFGLALGVTAKAQSVGGSHGGDRPFNATVSRPYIYNPDNRCKETGKPVIFSEDNGYDHMINKYFICKKGKYVPYKFD
jgi:hypothetical protein